MKRSLKVAALLLAVVFALLFGIRIHRVVLLSRLADAKGARCAQSIWYKDGLVLSVWLFGFDKTGSLVVRHKFSMP